MLTLMGWVMFCSSVGNCVTKELIPLAQRIADTPLEDIPEISWGSAVLACTLRGLCSICMKSRAAEPTFTGCPMLLQLWSYERFQIGRPVIDMSPYPPRDRTDPVDGPTMGWVWTIRTVSFHFIRLHLFTNHSYANLLLYVRAA